MTATSEVQVLRPRSVAEVRDVMRDAAATNDLLQITGAGSWPGAGAPVHSTRSLSLGELSGIIAYVPGDLTITAYAGTSMAELAHATAAHGQWLGLDPAGDRRGTIGATIATASCGPLSHAFGTPRDQILGLDAVTGYGEIVKPGGRVVKNVAGFDLVRLYTGSWGTLGPIASVTLRLRALPVHDVTLAIDVANPGRLPALLTALRDPTLSMMACEWLDATAARAVGITSAGDIVLVRLGGNDSFVRGQRALLDAIAPCAPSDPSVWGRLADLDRHAPAVVRVSGSVQTLPQRIRRLHATLTEAPDSRVALHARISRGIVRIVASGNVDGLQAPLQSAHEGEQRIAERLPARWWATEADPFAGGLAGRIRAAFDPDTRCNRRAFVEA